MSICLATGNEVVLDSIFSVPTVFCKVGGHAITSHITCLVINNLSYNMILGINWLKSTNPVMHWVGCSLELTVDANLHTTLALTVNSIAYITLSSLEQVQNEVKCGCPVCFGLVHPH